MGDGGKEASEGGAEIAGGHVHAGKVIGDILAGFFAGEGLRILAGVERAEVRMRGAGSAAVAAVGMVDMEVSRRKIRFWVFGESRGGEAQYLTTKVYQSDNCTVNKISLHTIQVCAYQHVTFGQGMGDEGLFS